MPLYTRPDGSKIQADAVVPVNYNRIEEDGEIYCYLKWQKYWPATMESPAEGGYYELVDWDGEILDDDLPDIENEANSIMDAKADDSIGY